MNEEYIELMKKQNKLLKMTMLLMLVLVVTLCSVMAVLVPKVNRTLDETVVAVQKMEVIADQLTEADLPGLVTDTKKLVDESNGALVEAMEKVQSMDIETLNTAISELETVVRPLAKLMGR